ncbi:WbqC family protein [Neolewinella sp.]|uniref:WbqC family protein n=1 Tax=Neolewinella sp. TaxID=2993543 RepID=UPI003B515990
MTAVMQPYLFPYLGYFHLMAAADHLVFYDDVQYINDGWINRNRLPHGWFTVPVAAGSLTDSIRERQVAVGPYTHFRKKFLKGFGQRYGKSPYFETAQRMVHEVFAETPGSVNEMAQRSVCLVADYLGLTLRYSTSTTYTYQRELPTQAKLLSLLYACRAERYVNQVGGSHLYDPEVFAASGVSLNFLQSDLDYSAEEPGLQYSVLHLLAHHPPQQCREWLQQYTITTPTYA